MEGETEVKSWATTSCKEAVGYNVLRNLCRIYCVHLGLMG